MPHDDVVFPGTMSAFVAHSVVATSESGMVRDQRFNAIDQLAKKSTTLDP